MDKRKLDAYVLFLLKKEQREDYLYSTVASNKLLISNLRGNEKFTLLTQFFFHYTNIEICLFILKKIERDFLIKYRNFLYK
ncbi:hypothetical protein CON65_20800 [Bacillus pseudomycoides]|uniref:Uncharacterized protein n=1 Tax=Bacillus pseudomycoides TaxID=64104 RepID=A0AA91V9A9_9BACI|nr:hypothetical protein COO03_23225 [Bacillus sp. AFS098217]PED80789.1 hypothetical protein CON65_20800 [Bacillus pseudomycoides]PEU08787.1 hypothetical protein CN525_25515 [Bacillus sp. AFS014408]PEU09684.1 hypothetical protein CN524_17755 [Bacillus sp. AFS019443]PFW56710.1 hypothetical protein COL20_26800 [Bacillus sp. AFS075034]